MHLVIKTRLRELAWMWNECSAQLHRSGVPTFPTLYVFFYSGYWLDDLLDSLKTGTIQHLSTSNLLHYLSHLLNAPAQLVGAAQPPAHAHGAELGPGGFSLLQGGQHVQQLLLSLRVEGPGIMTCGQTCQDENCTREMRNVQYFVER